VIRLPDFLATVRTEITPHLDILAEIERKACDDPAAAEHDLAAWLACLVRDANPDVRRELAAIRAQLDHLTEQLEKIMTEQASVDAATAELTSIVTDVQAQLTQLGTDFTNIQAEITSLQSQGVDTSALDAAVAQAQSTMSGLDPAVAQISSLAPAPSAPAPSGDDTTTPAAG
jgi:septal ring factor EnvC (AmiA/AmiB activator)